MLRFVNNYTGFKENRYDIVSSIAMEETVNR